jgi:GAF domain-containing protein
MDNVTRLITERLGHYYAAIFLLDETQNWAELTAATGDAGKVLKQNKHRLDIKSKNIVAESINNQTMQLLDANNPAHIQLSNPLLPYTKSEISLPLVSSNRVIGALNVHATRENAFGALEIETLQAIASHTAITLENARLYQEVQQNLKELSSIQQQYLLNSWSKLTKENNIEYSLGEDDPTAKADSNIPLSLRDQLLGEIYLQTNDKWTPEEQNLVDAIAVQATIAIENARLINESRQMAYLEQLAAEISNKIWTSATIDGVLQVVARDLGRALDADKLVIELALDKKGQND